MGYYSQEQLRQFSFLSIGKNVLISDKVSIYNPTQIALGDNVRIDDFCVLSGRITLGRNVHIAVFCNIAGGEEGIVVGDFSGFAYGCQVFTQSDDYSGESLTNPTVPDRYKKETKKKIHVGRHCIVGVSSVILPGVTLSEGTAVGAMSLVAKKTEPWSVYFGIPAKKIKNRSSNLLKLEQQFLGEK